MIGPYDRAAGAYGTFAVAHESPEAVDAGAAMLARGGNAVDAAVAVAFAACVTMPPATTIAGSGFLLVDPGGGAEPVAVEFPARAPLGATADMYEVEQEAGRTARMGVVSVVGDANARGARAVGVPAVVAGLCTAHARFGRLALHDVMAPAIALAATGFAVHPELQLQTLEVVRELREENPCALGTLLTDDGLPWAADAGSEEPALVVQPELAATLRAIAAGGPDALYRGEPGEKIVAEVQRRGGILSLEDLARTEPLTTSPLSVRIGEAVLSAPTSPNGGWTELQILGVLARLDGMLDGTEPFDVRAFVEASRCCFADRFHFMADPEHVDVPLDVLLGDDYLDALAARVADALTERARGSIRYPDAAPWAYYASRVPEAFARHRPDLVPTPWEGASASVQPGPGDALHTTHLATVDGSGMAVSCTLTAGDLYGSRTLAAGAVLDDAMIWFNAVPGAANSIAPWKRPLVNMGPLIVRHDDGRRLAVGAPGGRRIISAVTQVVAHWMRGDSLEQATARPRVDASGGELLVSARLPREQLRALREARHAVRLVEDRDPFCYELARPVAVSLDPDGGREAAVQPYVRGFVAGR